MAIFVRNHVHILEWPMNKYFVIYGNNQIMLKNLDFRQVVLAQYHMILAHTKMIPMQCWHANFGVNCKNCQLEWFVKVDQHVHMKTTLHLTMISSVNSGQRMFG